MNQELINRIIFQMSDCLDNMQLMKLKDVLENSMTRKETGADDSHELLDRFLSVKRLEGRSERTLKYYKSMNEKMLNTIGKNVRSITTDDLRGYMSDYQGKSNAGKQTLENMRLTFSSFFNWLEDENYILRSPVKRIHKIKVSKVVKEAFSDEELERLRGVCKEKRDLAIVDFLVSTGVRIGELVRINREDINFTERECIVLGKGDKERIVYFDARTKLHLQQYVEERIDNNQALFVGIRSPHKRITINNIEARIRELGRKAGIKKCHPHRFRRTMATVAVDKGMPIEQVQKLLGHEKIDTTMHYAIVRQSNIKNSHRRYIG